MDMNLKLEITPVKNVYFSIVSGFNLPRSELMDRYCRIYARLENRTGNQFRAMLMVALHLNHLNAQ